MWDTLAPELTAFSPSLPACSSAPSAVTIVLAVIGSVVLIGIILLGLWKLLVTIHDRREFDRFQSERSRARYEMVSQGRGYVGAIGMHQQQTALQRWRRVAGTRDAGACALQCHVAGLQGVARHTALPLGKLQILCKIIPSLWFHRVFPSSAGGLKEVGEWGPSPDCGGSQVGQVYEAALLGGFKWGCPAFEGITCASRQDGRWVWWTNNTAFGSECTFQSKPNAAVSPHQLVEEGGIICIFTMAWTFCSSPLFFLSACFSKGIQSSLPKAYFHA